jgi:hypothetical protein
MQAFKFETIEVGIITDRDHWNEFTDNLYFMFHDFKEESRAASRPDVISIEWLWDLIEGDPTGRPESIHLVTTIDGPSGELAAAVAMTTPREGGTYVEFIYSGIKCNGKYLLEYIEEVAKAEGKTHVSLCSLICALPPYLSLGYSPQKPSGQRGWNATLTVTSWPLRVAESTAAKQKTRHRMTMRANVDTVDNCITLYKDRKRLGRVPSKRMRYRARVRFH